MCLSINSFVQSPNNLSRGQRGRHSHRGLLWVVLLFTFRFSLGHSHFPSTNRTGHHPPNYTTPTVHPAASSLRFPSPFLSTPSVYVLLPGCYPIQLCLSREGNLLLNA